MKIRIIDFRDDNKVLIETENAELIPAMLTEGTQIQITQEKEYLYCKYLYNVLKVIENEIDIYVEIDDTTPRT
ncbi:hypothetical protein [Clostridium yunnanense]|nr:hypothetical protein [Clostridium yunnanense]